MAFFIHVKHLNSIFFCEYLAPLTFYEASKLYSIDLLDVDRSLLSISLIINKSTQVKWKLFQLQELVRRILRRHCQIYFPNSSLM